VAGLLSKLCDFAKSYFGSESAILTRERHKTTLVSAKDALDRVLTPAANSAEEIIAEELRATSQSLGRLTGQVDVEDLLDVIFRDFCVGK
jgi:tRNA modification GTPase